jgi:hypothetical protein
MASDDIKVTPREDLPIVIKLHPYGNGLKGGEVVEAYIGDRKYTTTGWDTINVYKTTSFITVTIDSYVITVDLPEAGEGGH